MWVGTHRLQVQCLDRGRKGRGWSTHATRRRPSGQLRNGPRGVSGSSCLTARHILLGALGDRGCPGGSGRGSRLGRFGCGRRLCGRSGRRGLVGLRPLNLLVGDALLLRCRSWLCSRGSLLLRRGLLLLLLLLRRRRRLGAGAGGAARELLLRRPSPAVALGRLRRGLRLSVPGEATAPCGHRAVPSNWTWSGLLAFLALHLLASVRVDNLVRLALRRRAADASRVHGSRPRPHGRARRLRRHHGLALRWRHGRLGDPASPTLGRIRVLVHGWRRPLLLRWHHGCHKHHGRLALATRCHHGWLHVAHLDTAHGRCVHCLSTLLIIAIARLLANCSEGRKPSLLPIERCRLHGFSSWAPIPLLTGGRRDRHVVVHQRLLRRPGIVGHRCHKTLSSAGAAKVLTPSYPEGRGAGFSDAAPTK
mmetsp:Transcript_46174/g.100793  ORF Transcript_46174/g.100793 Transcript_46174/m.100793 type:complete len:420 (-) Transcript_46174:8-1267(-)